MSLENSYFSDLLENWVEGILSKILFALALSLFVLLSYHIYLFFMTLSSCSTVFGLSITGRVFETYSFTCSNSVGTTPLY